MLAAGLLVTTGCERERFPLELEHFDVYWYDLDRDGHRTPADEVEFDITANTTDPDPDEQFIVEWELTYEVNGRFGGILQGDEGIRSNSVNISAVIGIEFLNYPGPGQFAPGDRIVFRFWAVDNRGTQMERSYSFVLE